MNGYWQGVLTIPVLVVAICAAWLAIRGLAHLAAMLVGAGLIRLGTRAPHRTRAISAGVVYAGKRVWMFQIHNLGVVLHVGIDNDEAAKAVGALDRLGRVSVRKVSPAFRERMTPTPRTDQREATGPRDHAHEGDQPKESNDAD